MSVQSNFEHATGLEDEQMDGDTQDGSVQSEFVTRTELQV